MRVTMCCKQFGAGGGAEAFLVNLARALAAEGHSVKVLAAASDAQVPGIQVVRLPRRWAAGPFKELAIARAAQRALSAEDADVTFSDQSCLGAQVVRAGGGLHRAFLREQARTYTWPAGRALYALRTALSLRERLRLGIEEKLFQQPSLRRLIVNSHMVRREVLAHYPHLEERVTVIYNGVDTERFSPALRAKHRARVRAELSLPADSLACAFVGHGWRRKGLATLIEALGILWRKGTPRPIHAIVVGRGDRHSAARLARRCGVEHAIRFVGPAAPEPYYGAADLLVLPTFYDPCANVTLEALACGLPAITTVRNGAHGLLTPGQDGFFAADAADAAQIAGFIEHFMDEAKLAAASQAARQVALQYPLERQCRRVMDVLEAVAQERLRTPQSGPTLAPPTGTNS